MIKRAGELFAELKSETRPRDLVRQMSGGQRQAVAIARTRLSEAKIVLMDEPTAAISVRQVAEVLDLIRRLRDAGIAVVLISHRMPDVFAVCDRVVVMRRGRKVADKRDRVELARGSHRAHHRRDPCRLRRHATSQTGGRRDSRLRPMSRSSPSSTRARRRCCETLVASQAFWVTVALVVICADHERSASRVFASEDNFYNITRNFAFIGIMALGHDGGDHHRRHRPVGRLDHGPGRGRLRPDAARRGLCRGGRAPIAGGGLAGRRPSPAPSTAC